MNLAPSILSFDLSALRDSVPALEKSGAAVLHLDVMDGQFVPPITFGDAFVASIRSCTDLPFEAHLMTLTPERHFEAFAEAGCFRITFHTEATVHVHRHVQTLKSMGLEAGLAINPSTPVEAILPLVDEIDLALVMTVNPGYGGQTFLPFVLDKARRLRELRPDLTIQVDGGIAPDTIRIAKEAGADLFVVGSYLAKAADLDAAVAVLEASWRGE
ncbi:ribulose-phosphate 3-epimerase [bacterium]|nr:MAG: ribulose-phosphate 3-epimerase [bacterium]